MPPRGSNLDRTAARPPTPEHPGRHVVDGVVHFWCDCPDRCVRMKLVSEATYYRHKRLSEATVSGAGQGGPSHAAHAPPTSQASRGLQMGTQGNIYRMIGVQLASTATAPDLGLDDQWAMETDEESDEVSPIFNRTYNLTLRNS